MDLNSSFASSLGRLFFSVALGVGYTYLSALFGPDYVPSVVGRESSRHLMQIDRELYFFGFVFFLFISGEAMSLFGHNILDHLRICEPRSKVQELASQTDSEICKIIYLEYIAKHDIAAGFTGLSVLLLANNFKFFAVEFKIMDAIELNALSMTLLFIGAFTASKITSDTIFVLKSRGKE